MNEPRMAALLTSHGRPGFYFRVLEEGEVQAGDATELVTKGPESMTVAEINAQLYLPGHSREEMERALRIPALSSGWRASFQALLQQGDGKSGNSGLAPSDLAPAAWAGFRDARITELKHETIDVVSLEIESGDGKDFTTPLPGQFVVLKVQLPSLASPVMRSFSICDVPRASAYRLGSKAEPRALVGPYLRDVAKVGDSLQVSAPRGSFVLRPGDEPIILLSAGIGVTPVLAMLHALVSESSQRELWWLYAARSRAEHPFASEIHTLVGELPRCRSHVWYSKPGNDDVIGRDFDSSGHIDTAGLSAIGVKPAGQFYLCGPASFLRDMRAGLIAWGAAADHIYSETFGSGPSVTPGVVSAKPSAPPHAPPGAPGTGPNISFARSGVVAPWSTAYLSLLEFAEACDVPVRWSCRTGVCHSCESGLISGEVTYNPEPLDPPARGDLLICCSTPRDDVVLDL